MAKRHIWPAIGNQNVARVGRQGFLEKNTTCSEPNLRSMGETEGEDFFIKTGGQAECNGAKTLPT